MKPIWLRIIYWLLTCYGGYFLYQGHVQQSYNQILRACLALGLALWCMHYPISWHA